MKNIHIMKLCGLMVLISFLFLPVVGCGPMTITGIDLFKNNNINALIKIFSGFAILCAIAILFLPNKTYIFFASLAGLVSLVIAYFIATGKTSSNNDFGIANSIELKSGAYLSIIGFAISSIISKIKNELFLKPFTSDSEQKQI